MEDALRSSADKHIQMETHQGNVSYSRVNADQEYGPIPISFQRKRQPKILPLRFLF